ARQAVFAGSDGIARYLWLAGQHSRARERRRTRLRDLTGSLDPDREPAARAAPAAPQGDAVLDRSGYTADRVDSGCRVAHRTTIHPPGAAEDPRSCRTMCPDLWSVTAQHHHEDRRAQTRQGDV